MTRLQEGEDAINPYITFENAITIRHSELIHLSDGLKQGLDLVSDLDEVNRRLAVSTRPDLVMTERVPMMPLVRIDDVSILNNFNPYMRSFGVLVLGDINWNGRPKIIGRRDFTEEERTTAFFMGARGNLDEHLAFAAENGIDRDFAYDLCMGTNINREAFMRMWILMPELTEDLMRGCLERRYDRDYERVREEIFVAYQLMSRLVDKNDRHATREDGSVDDYLLCH